MTEFSEPENRMPVESPAPVPTVWPPPPTNSPPMPAGVIPSVFLPLGGFARALVILLSLSAALAVLGFAGALALMPPTTRQILAGSVAVIQALLLMATGLCFLVWTYRLHRNLRLFGISGLRSGPGWAVAYFFIPILSIYRPYGVFREIWQASDPDPAQRERWQTLRAPALLGFWWLSFLLMNVMDGLSAQSGSTADIEAADNAAGFVAALLALQVVRLWTARQGKTARSLSLLP